MKNTVKVAGILVLMALYCFAINVIAESTPKANLKIFPSTDQETYFSGTSVKLYCHLPETERIINGLNHFPAPGFKDPLYAFFGTIKWIEQLFATEYSQYTNFSINFLIQYRKSDLIFPFHYFW